MKLCTDTITVFNRRINTETRMEEYVPTVIKGVSWYGRLRSSVGDKGLNTANEFTVRIPVDADFDGKSYIAPKSYREETIVSGVFTLANDDIVVKGAVEAGANPATIIETCSDCFRILGVTDNRRAPNAPHFKVVGS